MLHGPPTAAGVFNGSMGRGREKITVLCRHLLGWSYGGYLSALSLCKRPDVFKAAVSGAPVTDWDGYDTHYTERYMGTPNELPDSPEMANAAGYKESAVMAHADKLQGSLMVCRNAAAAAATQHPRCTARRFPFCFC